MPESPRGPTRFFRHAALLGASIAMLTLAFAPMGQFYLAWVGLVPWLIWLAESRSRKSAFFGSWIAGTLFFIANMWWMASISWPGMFALMIVCGIFWPIAGTVIREAGLLKQTRPRNIFGAVLAIAVIWTAAEWVRGIIFTGLPWLYLGHAQTPILAMCQIADIAGSYGVSFWVMLINALVAVAWLNRKRLRIVLPAGLAVAVVTVCSLAYGLFRMYQTPGELSPGPTIAVVQSNYPQTNTGEKGAKLPERLDFNLQQSRDAFAKTPGKIDMVVWSETMMEALNATARLEIPIYQDTYDVLSRFTRENHLALLAGGEYCSDWKDEVRDDGTYTVPEDRRNTAYFFDQNGNEDDSPGHRYDKIHLVPWGEYIPGKESLPFLYKLSVQLGPKYYSDYVMQPGDTLTVFHLSAGGKDFRFVTPICFEDIDARICSAMFRPEADGQKRADFLVNLTNDGWFKGTENADHLQAAIFRSIENRVWTARSVNTGISGFIDSIGNCSDLLPVREVGFSVRQIMIDGRLSFYTKFGDVFAYTCDAVALGIAAWAFWKPRGAQMKKDLP
jgi:apolipoprotein N-acyltransferase